MKGARAMTLWKKNLELDPTHHITASYQEGGTFFGRLWPVTKQEQKANENPRLLLISDGMVSIDEGDQIEKGLAHYRTLWARRFPRHTEAMLEQEHE